MRHSAALFAGMTGATTAEFRAMMGRATAGMVECYRHANRTSRSRLAENMSKLVDLMLPPHHGERPAVEGPGSFNSGSVNARSCR